MSVESFAPSKAAVRLLEDQGDMSLMLKENSLWIESVKKRGLSVLDLGLGGAPDAGEFYKLELEAMRQHLSKGIKASD